MPDIDTVRVEALLAAAGAVSTTFAAIPEAPVPVRDPSAIGALEAAEIADRYARHGFAIVQLGGPVTPGTLTALAGSLDLGAPFVPPLYGNAVPTISRISAAANAGTAEENHPSFGRTVGQALHSDGTLQDIGYVKATLLVCETPAEQGGDTVLFNASAAYSQLAEADVPAAVALATPGSLVRQANINGSTDLNAGPAFAVRDGGLVSRYSVTETDRWAVPAGVDPAVLWRGVGFLLHASLPGSRHFARLALAAGQAIVFDNTRISHGRTSYRDSPARRRCLFRGLYLRHPKVHAVHSTAAGEVSRAA